MSDKGSGCYQLKNSSGNSGNKNRVLPHVTSTKNTKVTVFIFINQRRYQCYRCYLLSGRQIYPVSPFSGRQLIKETVCV